MPTDAQVLTLAQWFSPAFPVGAFAYSHGLEAAVEAGTVTDAASLSVWLRNILEHGSGHSDALLLAAAFRAETVAGVRYVDDMCRAFAPGRERLMETDLQGAAFGAIAGSLWEADLAGLSYPVAVGWAAQLCDLPLELTCQMYLQSFMSNLVAAGQRLAPIGQTDGQMILRDLGPLCQRVAHSTHDGDLDKLTSTVFLADIASMKHETQYSKVFRT